MQRSTVLAPLAASLACVLAAERAVAQGLPQPPVPVENPITEAKRVLGKALFWDEQLSEDDTVACGTCHIPGAGGSDPRLDIENRHPGLDGVYGGPDDRFASAGVTLADVANDVRPSPLFGFERQVTGRHAPTNIGAAFFTELFWDGRATSTFVDPETGAVAIQSGGALESQSLGPILSSVEMAGEGRSWYAVTSKLARVRPLALATDLNPDLTGALAIDPTYPELFENAFGDPAITARRIAFALATYQRTLHPDQTPWDRYVAGQTSALTPQQVSGMNSFNNTNLACAICHAPPLFADGTYRNLGLRAIAEDNGRQAVTGLHSDRGRFKVPTLRNVALRSRYFHHGDPAMPSLFNAVFIYNQGAGFFLDNKDPLLAGIVMAPSTASNITAFLSALTDPRVENELPPFDRPTLRSELGPLATLSGVATQGSGGFAPAILADVPAVVGNRDFRVGVHAALGGALAQLTFRYTAPSPLGGPASAGVDGPIVVGGLVALSGAGAGNGYGTWHTSIPFNTAMIGQRIWFQWRIADPGAARGVTVSELAELTFL